MKLPLVRLASLLCAVVLVALAGCETEPTDQSEITITPGSANLHNGESVEFTATGWRDYEWVLDEPTKGTLSRTRGDSTVYTCRTTNSITTYIRAQAQMGDDGGTNSGSTMLTGQAVLVLNEGGEVSASPVTMYVNGNSVSSFSLAKTNSCTLTASGGSSSSYSWSAVPTTYGSLSSSSGSSVTYTATTNAGSAVVTCSSGGESDTVTITTN